VLPFVSAATIAADVIHAIAAADVCIAIEVVVHVDVDIAASPAATPTPTAAPRSAHGQTDAKRDCACCNHCSRRWWIVNWWIRISRCAVYNRRVIGRHVNNFRIRLFDHNHFLALNDLRLHFLLLVRRQRPRVLRLIPHTLDRVHHVFLLGQKCISEIGGPLNIVGQAFHNVR
jgi:hypothetical protein